MIYYAYTNQKKAGMDTWITVQIDFTEKKESINVKVG